ncbi:Peptide chain release factor 1-like, mitochondrial [Cichlidogyrus casuarinus]|uniref:Peptide chain release factor 1-like, mitochondrial n=1 Tax=Cichlidogyrus casuarinus TaxID=1844966 RepID=A0ABD2QLU3_9PLAT
MNIGKPDSPHRQNLRIGPMATQYLGGANLLPWLRKATRFDSEQHNKPLKSVPRKSTSSISCQPSPKSKRPTVPVKLPKRKSVPAVPIEKTNSERSFAKNENESNDSLPESCSQSNSQSPNSPKNRISTYYYVNSDSDEGEAEILSRARIPPRSSKSQIQEKKSLNKYSWLSNWWLHTGSQERSINPNPRNISPTRNWFAVSDQSESESPVPTRDASLNTSWRLLKTPSRDASLAFNKIICDKESYFDCIAPEKMGVTREHAKQLFELLSRISGRFHCEPDQLKSPYMDVSQAKNQMNQLLSDRNEPNMSEELWDDVMLLIRSLGPDQVFIKCYDYKMNSISPANYSEHNVKYIESTKPYFTGRCRLYFFTLHLFEFAIFVCKLVFYTCVVASFGYGGYRFMLWRRDINKQRKSKVADIVSYIREILQERLSESERDLTGSIPQFIPVLEIMAEVRERFVTESGQLSMDNLWPDVMNQVLQKESSVLVENVLGVGEAWSWQRGTGWQGSALHNESLSRKVPFSVPPTECLKIRNMCVTDGLDEARKSRVKLDLFRKIKHCGPILHIGVTTSSDQPIVYLCCESPEVAGRVYSTVNANYYDGRLVTARFLKLDRYCQRFPETLNNPRPLTERSFL